MIVYEQTEKLSKSDIETVAYFNIKDGKLTVAQCLYDGPEVLSHSSITLSTQQYNEIIDISNAIYLKKFLNLYTLE